MLKGIPSDASTSHTIGHARVSAWSRPHSPPSMPTAPSISSAIERQAEELVRQRLRGVFVCGTSGEFASLTVPERMEIARRWREVAGPDLEVIVHVGHTSLGDARGVGRARRADRRRWHRRRRPLLFSAARGSRGGRFLRAGRRRRAEHAVLLLSHSLVHRGRAADGGVSAGGLSRHPHLCRTQVHP